MKRSKSKEGSEARDLRKDLPIVAHEFSLEELAATYSVSFEHGLTSAQVLESRTKHGPNRLTPPKSKPAWMLYMEQYTNFFSLLLLGGGLLCFVAYAIDTSDPSNLYLGVVLVAVVVFSSTFAYFQEAKSQAIMDGFKALLPRKCKALRDGAATILDASDLVPGDVVEFQEGDQVPADIRVIFAYGLKVDNSSLTGESEACERVAELLGVHGGGKAAGGDVEEGGGGRSKVPAIEASNLLFYSTLVASGHGRGVVIGTGDNTVMGQIAGLTTETSTDTSPPIVRETNRFITIISAIAITLGVVFLSVGIGLKVMSVVQALVFAISCIVAVVPEGLLVTMTVALALTAKRLHARNVLVNNLQAVETLGCTTVIASDKTGTLTQNRMTVQHAWYDGALYEIPACRNAPELEAALAEAGRRGPHGWPQFSPAAPTFAALQRVAALCNNADFIVQDPLDPCRPLLDVVAEARRPEFNLLGLNTTGDASESGLIKAVQLLRDVKQHRAAYPKLFEIKFNSTNKYQISIHDQTADGEVAPLLLMKGAPERVWAVCSHLLVGGRAEPITPEWEARFTAAYEALGGLGERVLGFACRDLQGLPHGHPWTDDPAPNFPTTGLTFVGLMSLIDPPRQGVPEAVATCRAASVRVFMVTGDHPLTARAIAEQIGILDPAELAAGRAAVVTGDDIRALQALPDPAKVEAAWDALLTSHSQLVFARVTPAHKLLIVEANQRLGRVVAVTGDGVNDAPALKKADIGISMGIAGKDVSKQAADMILMDDNFASIVNGVEEGRLIFDNLKKSITYTLTSKIPELSPFLLWVAGGLPLATTTILILVIDLGTDMIPAISFAYERREADIMARAPRDAGSDHLVDWRLLAFTYLHIGMLQALAGWFAFMVTMHDYGYPPALLMGLGFGWAKHPLLCGVEGGGAGGKPAHCGYGCADWRPGPAAAATAAAANLTAAQAGALAATSGGFCQHGCGADNRDGDPFSEFAPGGAGFRGFGAGVGGVCGRTCGWYGGLGEAGRAALLAAAGDPGSPLRLILTPEDDRQFQYLCAPGRFPPPVAATFGFPGRGRGDSRAAAEVGAQYYWRAALQAAPNLKYQRSALSQGQTAYFAAVVLNKVAAALIAKTRKLSLLKQGILSNRFMLFGFVFEACLVVLLSYTPPLNTVFSTGPLHGLHWLLGVPWVIVTLAYDESRKAAMRRWPGGWVERLTWW